MTLRSRNDCEKQAGSAAESSSRCKLNTPANDTVEDISAEQSTHVSSKWWLSQALTLPPRKCTAWVVAQVLTEYMKENETAQVCNYKTFKTRMADGGLESLLASGKGPRQLCKDIAQVAANHLGLLDENA